MILRDTVKEIADLGTFTITLHTIPDPETGAKFLLPTESELAEGRNQLNTRLTEARDRAKSKTKSDREVGEAQVRIVQDALSGLDRLEAKRKALLDKATTETYLFERPTYAEYLEFESAAKQMDEDGEVRVDNAILMQSLLPHCLKKINGKDANVGDLELNIAMHLWKKLLSAIFPDNSRLPFLF